MNKTTVIDYFDETEYDWLSNFHPSPIMWPIPGGKEILVPTVEHVFQAEKTLDGYRFLRIITARSPGEAKWLGNSRKYTKLRSDWDSEHKFNVMLRALRLKFTSDSMFASMLLGTGDAQLIEGNHWHDNIWGNCICGDFRCDATEGQNHLGRMLMHVRWELTNDVQMEYNRA